MEEQKKNRLGEPKKSGELKKNKQGNWKSGESKVKEQNCKVNYKLYEIYE